MTLLELLTQAEGLSDDAGRTAIITRASNPQPGPGSHIAANAFDPGPTTSKTLEVDVWRLWQNGDAKSNANLFPGDRVMIPRAGIVYVMGAVNRAGGFPLSNEEEQMTMLKAIALAGNFSPHAKLADAVILRKVPNAPGGREQIRVNLKKVLSNRAPDRQLMANDILYVPESGVKKALDGVATAAITTTIWRAPL
jgi:polysaccharide export outer membrane protein